MACQHSQQTRRRPNTGPMLAHRLSLWPSIKPALAHSLVGGGPRVVVSTAAFHARVRGSVPGLGGLKETKLFLPHPRVKVSIVGSLRDREVACSASDRQGSNFESCVWRTVSSQSSHHPQEVLLAQFSLYVHKGGLKPDSFHFHSLVFAGLRSLAAGLEIAYRWQRLQANTNPMFVKCWASIAGAGQYLFSPIQYFMLPVPASWRYGHGALNQSWVNIDPLPVTLTNIQRGAKHDTVTHTGLMLAQRRNGGPLLAQHWVNVSCLTACTIESAGQKHINEWTYRRRERTDTN